MIGATLTRENLEAIRSAMDAIEHIDQSDYFRQYYAEVLQRLADIDRAELASMLNNDQDDQDDDDEDDDQDDYEQDDEDDDDDQDDDDEDDFVYVTIRH
jgi:hypothetical protein